MCFFFLLLLLFFFPKQESGGLRCVGVVNMLEQAGLFSGWLGVVSIQASFHYKLLVMWRGCPSLYDWQTSELAKKRERERPFVLPATVAYRLIVLFTTSVCCRLYVFVSLEY